MGEKSADSFWMHLLTNIKAVHTTSNVKQKCNSKYNSIFFFWHFQKGFKHFSIRHWLDKQVIVGLNRALLCLTLSPKRTMAAQFDLIHKLAFLVFKPVTFGSAQICNC